MTGVGAALRAGRPGRRGDEAAEDRPIPGTLRGSRPGLALGDQIHLTPTEFELLRLLTRNRGRLRPTATCCVPCGARGTARTPRSMRAHIANLRRKIEGAGGPR